MKGSSGTTVFQRLLVAPVVSIFIVASASGQAADKVNAVDPAIATRETKLQQVNSDKASYARALVQRWESDALSAARWDPNYSTDLFQSLMSLQPENLLAAGEASSYKGMLTVLATGSVTKSAPSPETLGSSTIDLVYTPITPCRIVDTRVSGGVIATNTTRTFDADGSNFSTQGGNPGACGIPFGVATAAAMTITVTQPAGVGFFTAWGLGARPLSSVINFTANDTLANTTIVPIVPGAGADFSVYSNIDAHAVIDVVGYFAAPVATPLDCTTVTNSGPIPAGAWTHVVVNCPSGRTATGGGFYYVFSNTQGKANPSGNGWDAGFFTANASETGTVYCNCCRVPGR